MEIELSLEFLRVVEQAAIESAKTMGRGDGHLADQAAVSAMRRVMDEVPMDGTIVIGEGERDEAPMLFIGEKIGAAQHVRGFNFPAVDIAVDPLEGTNLCATGAPGSITVLAASEKGGLLHAPDLYMEKIIVGPSCKGAVDLDAPVADNLRRDRQASRSRRRGFGRDCPRPAAPRKTDRRHSRRRRAHSPDRRWRPLRRHFRGRHRAPACTQSWASAALPKAC